MSAFGKLQFIEPVMFLILFAYAISDSLITDVIVYKTCLKIFGQSGNCSILYENSSSDAAKALQNIVQPQIATLLTIKSSVETFFPTAMIIFLGPWSDTNGRKPLMVYPFLGSIAYYLSYAAISHYNLDPHWFILPSTISSAMGGFPTILFTGFCYIADVTNSENRAWRLSFLDFSIAGGMLIGFPVGPLIFKSSGYTVVFLVAALSCSIGFVYALFCLKESIVVDAETKKGFTFSLLKEMVWAVTAKRTGFDRVSVWTCLVMISLQDMMQGTSNIIYLFVKRFGWSVTDFSNYSTIQLIVTMTGMMLLTKAIAPVLRMPDTISVMLASLSNGASSLAKAFAQQSWHLYLSIGIGLFSAAPSALIRSIISKSVPANDVGKAFAVATTMEKLGPFLTTPVFVHLYTEYIKTYPCPVWFLPAGLSFLTVLLTIILERRRIHSNLEMSELP